MIDKTLLSYLAFNWTDFAIWYYRSQLRIQTFGLGVASCGGFRLLSNCNSREVGRGKFNVPQYLTFILLLEGECKVYSQTGWGHGRICQLELPLISHFDQWQHSLITSSLLASHWHGMHQRAFCHANESAWSPWLRWPVCCVLEPPLWTILF